MELVLGMILTGALLLPSQAPAQAFSQDGPRATEWEIIYEEKAIEGYRFRGTARKTGGKPGWPGPEGISTFHRYRILKATPLGAVCLRDIRAADLAQARGPGQEAGADPYGGLRFLALNPARGEAYFTSVVEAARSVTREVFAVPLNDGAIRLLGSFTTAGEGLRSVQLSPSGDYLSFLGLCGGRVPQGLIVLRLDGQQVLELPFDQEVRKLCAKWPSWALTITGYQWRERHFLVFHQRIVPNPECPEGSGPGAGPPSEAILERHLDVRQERIIQEIWTAPPPTKAAPWDRTRVQAMAGTPAAQPRPTPAEP